MPTQTSRLPGCFLPAVIVISVFCCHSAFAQRGYEFEEETADRFEEDWIGPVWETNDLFVFANGSYVAPPYVFRADGQRLKLDGVEGTFAVPEMETTEHPMAREDRGRGGRGFDGREHEDRRAGRRRRGGPGGGRGPARQPDPNRQAKMFLMSMEEAGINAVVVLHDQQPPVLLQGNSDALEFFAVKLDRPLPDQKGEAWLPSASVQDLASSTKVTGAFLERAASCLDELDRVEAQVYSQQVAREWIRKFNYPITMLAIVLAVFAVGHLMAHAQTVFADSTTPLTTPHRMTFVKRALVVVLMMSAIDLTWTVLGHQSGTMREMNPIGGQFISDPMSLLVFKAGMTFLAVGLLFSLRHLALAQKATWWSCLVLTLLTARWVTFQSMVA